MDLIRVTIGFVILGFVCVTHLIGFNNVRVLDTFWMPEFALLLYLIFTLIPFEAIPGLYKKLNTFIQTKRKKKKIVKLKTAKKKFVPVAAIFDGILVAAVAALSLLLLYRI